jgi:hypothetical protein
LLVLATAAQAEDVAQQAKICDIKKDPGAYNHKLIRVTGLVSSGFEDFTFVEPTCPTGSEIWIEYGGVTSSGTIYCCGDHGGRKRPAPIRIENISVPLVVDDRFREFDHIVRRAPHTFVHGTFVGRFFAGEQPPGASRPGGYGHFGCCSLFVIQQVTALDRQVRADLDYLNPTEPPNVPRVGCDVEDLTFSTPTMDPMAVQKDAENAQDEAAFSDPKRALSSAVRLLKLEMPSGANLKEAHISAARIQYEWGPKGEPEKYRLVASHPYWLSLYSKDPQRVVWVIVSAYRLSCK